MAIAHRFRGLIQLNSCPAAADFVLFLKTLVPIRNLSLTSLQNQCSTPLSSELSSGHDSSMVNYLIDSCGLSKETAISASQKVRFRSTKKPEQILSILRVHGLSENQISDVIRKRPSILLADPENTILPKLQFFLSIGMSKTDLAKIVSGDSSLLTRSLENQIQPSYNFLKSVLVSDDKIVQALKRSTWILLKDQSKFLIPNIVLLRELGAPQNCISLLLTHFPQALVRKHEAFLRITEEAKEMGFNPKKSTFVLALRVLSVKGNKWIWSRCFEVYKNWGWSRDDILEAFRRHPHCMMMSEKNIVDTMDYFVSKMGFPSRFIAKCPTVLLYSLEKRIKPRCSVIQVLSCRGLVKEDLRLTAVLCPPEKIFLRRFVSKHEHKVPGLLDLYRGEVDLQSLMMNL